MKNLVLKRKRSIFKNSTHMKFVMNIWYSGREKKREASMDIHTHSHTCKLLIHRIVDFLEILLYSPLTFGGQI